MAAFKYSLNTQKMQPGVGVARPGWCGVGGGGGEGAGGCGHALAAFKYSLGVSSGEAGWDGVWAAGVVRARGGVGTHGQPYASQVWVVARPGWGGVWAVGVVGGVGTHWQSLNTLDMRARCG